MADIIKQGEWGNGDLTGAHKEVEEGYVKFLKKFGLQREGYGRGRATGQALANRFTAGVNDDPDGIANDSTNSDL